MRMRKKKEEEEEESLPVVEIVEAEVADALSGGSPEDASSSETESKAATDSEPEEDRHESNRVV